MKLNLECTATCRVDMKSRWVTGAAALMGLSFFLRLLYYFGLRNLRDFDIPALILQVILPLLVCGIFCILLRGIRLMRSEIYGILAAVYCLLVMVWSFDSGNVFRIILAVVWYLLAGAAILGAVYGFIGNMLIPAFAFAIPVIYRIVMFDFGAYIQKLDFVGFLPELAVLCGLGSFFCFARCLDAKPVKKPEAAEETFKS